MQPLFGMSYLHKKQTKKHDKATTASTQRLGSMQPAFGHSCHYKKTKMHERSTVQSVWDLSLWQSVFSDDNH